ncbi:homoserine O-succinyltransferase [Oscillospiraceae bacterium MB08-C2-2]|nr:homoserine O-succinyltransferase [Oscillospiraceae bacterium MB08-C2-2]
MPVIIPEKLPATQALIDSNIFVMNEGRAHSQDIRPLRICILNLMPDKITTETQLLRKLSNSIIQVQITLLTMKSHTSKNTSAGHLKSFYQYFEEIKEQNFDGIIITGAPLEHLPFETVDYWKELAEILDWCKTHAFSSLFICWAAQAALYHYYGIEKNDMPEKLLGVFPHCKEDPKNKLFLGMNDTFFAPHSRYTQSDAQAIRNNPQLTVLASSEQAGIHLVASRDGRRLFMSGHPEYDRGTLLKEYQRDQHLENAPFPQNYFQDNDPTKEIIALWESDASLFYLNWLNYSVYQETEYELLLK